MFKKILQLFYENMPHKGRDGKSKEIYRYIDQLIYRRVYIERNISMYSIYQKKYIDLLFFPK